MSVVVPENLDLTTLPSLPVVERAGLPNVAAIYFVLNEDHAVLYVGRTGSLSRRWQSHNRFPQFAMLPNVSIAWLVVAAIQDLNAMEQHFIDLFRPPFNGTIEPAKPCEDFQQFLRETRQMTLGDKLKRQRLLRGYTQSQLAREAGVSQGLIARIEHQQVKDPSSGVLRRIARVLGCSIDWLVGTFDDDPADPARLALAGASP